MTAVLRLRGLGMGHLARGRPLRQHRRMRLLGLIAGGLLCGFIGFAVAMGARIAVPGADGGDWLTAGAGAAGVMLTVLAAVLIERYRHRWQERAAHGRLREVLAELDDAIGSVRRLPDWTGAIDDYATALAALRRLLNAICKYHFVRGKAEISDLKLWEALEETDTALDRHFRDLAQEHSALGSAGSSDQAAYAACMREVDGMAVALAPYVAAAKWVADRVD